MQSSGMRARGAGIVDCFIDKRLSIHADTEYLTEPSLNAARSPWYAYFAFTFAAILMQLILGWPYVFPDEVRPACGQFDETNGMPLNTKMCGLEQTLRRGHSYLQFLTAIVLGGYVANTVFLWRLRRTSYCALCGATRNLLIQIGTLVPDSDAKVCMERWVILGYELAVLKARGQLDADRGREYLEFKGLLAGGGEEWDNMVQGDRHTTVWYWIQHKSVALAEEGVITSEQRLQTLCQAVTLIRDKANDLMSCIDRDQPLAYSSATGINVSFSVITKSLWKGIQWAIWFYETRGKVWLEPKMYVDIFILLSYTTILQILYDIDQVLYNPFGNRELDIPHHIVGGGLRNLATRLGSTSCFPPSEEGTKVLPMKEPEMKGAVNVAENIEYERNEVFGAQKSRRMFFTLPSVRNITGRTTLSQQSMPSSSIGAEEEIFAGALKSTNIA